MSYRHFCLSILLSMVTLIISGCFVIGCTVAGVGGALIYDQRNVKTILIDNEVNTRVTEALKKDEQIKRQASILCSTYRGGVLLAGQAPTEELRQRIVEITKKIPNVKRIYNEIALQAPSSALTTTSDAWITAKVKTALLGTKGLNSGQFKIVTENGTVFLMGVVERKQADAAVAATRKVDGVQKVVKIFEYKQ